jgi:DNA processing protein
MSQDSAYWLALTLIPGLGSVRVQQLVQHFGSAEAAWKASADALPASPLPPGARDALLTKRSQIDPATELKRVQQLQARIITLDDAEYPALLRTIATPPPVLYVKGRLPAPDTPAIAIVGTRSATKYGSDMAYRIARDLARRGVWIVSGLAQGVDTAAHRGALSVEGDTIAVLGCGIDRVYPQQNKGLAEDIVLKERGALITEFPVGTPPSGINFPRRNRILSGLALGVLITEAPEGSGSLITASFALEQGRDVYAVPANITMSSSTGTNRLIQDGAKLVMSADDILSELRTLPQQPVPRPARPSAQPRAKASPSPAAPQWELNESEAALLSHMTDQPMHVDDLVRASGLRTDTVISTLTLLELKGLAQMVGSMHYCRSHGF